MDEMDAQKKVKCMRCKLPRETNKLKNGVCKACRELGPPSNWNKTGEF